MLLDILVPIVIYFTFQTWVWITTGRSMTSPAKQGCRFGAALFGLFIGVFCFAPWHITLAVFGILAILLVITKYAWKT